MNHSEWCKKRYEDVIGEPWDDFEKRMREKHPEIYEELDPVILESGWDWWFIVSILLVGIFIGTVIF